MTDRVKKIIGQLADFNEQELDIIAKEISGEKIERRKKKFYELRDNFFDTARELEKLGYCLYWGDDRIDFNDLNFE